MGSCFGYCRFYCEKRTILGSISGVKQLYPQNPAKPTKYFNLESKDHTKEDLELRSVNDASLNKKLNFVESQKRKLIEFFLPTNYPHSVNSDYWDVQKHWNVQWATSSALQVFATQSLLTSVGIGSDVSLPLAATANWVLKVCIY